MGSSQNHQMKRRLTEAVRLAVVRIIVIVSSPHISVTTNSPSAGLSRLSDRVSPQLLTVLSVSSLGLYLMDSQPFLVAL